MIADHNGSVLSKKNNVLNFITLTIGIIALTGAILIYWTSPKIAYIDSSILMQKYKGAITASQKIDKKKSEYQKNLKTLNDELTALNREMVSKGSSLSKRELNRAQKNIDEKQQQLMKYSRAVSQKLVKFQQEQMQPITDELNVYIKEYAQKKGYDIIWGTVQGGNILYGSKSVDVTDDFIKYANEK